VCSKLKVRGETQGESPHAPFQSGDAENERSNTLARVGLKGFGKEGLGVEVLIF
jgi:hypothetical protein